jgi:hypothetical protein
MVLGVYKDGGAEKPSSVVAQKTLAVKPTKETWYEITGYSFEIVSGTKYWFAVVGVGGSVGISQREEGFKVLKSTNAHTELVEDTWATPEGVGPWDFQILGTESGGTIKAGGTASVVLASSTAARQLLTPAASSAVRLGQALAVKQLLTAVAHGAITIADHAAAATLASVTAGTAVVLQDGATVSQASRLAGTNKLTFAAKATASAGSSGGTRRVSIFIFED